MFISDLSGSRNLPTITENNTSAGASVSKDLAGSKRQYFDMLGFATVL